MSGSIVLVDNKIIFNEGNYTLYCLDKENLKPFWQKKIGWRSDVSPNIYEQSLLYGYYDGEFRYLVQYDLHLEKSLKR